MRKLIFSLATLAVLSGYCQSSMSYGFDDSGLVSAPVKTSYVALSEGTSSNPLTILTPFSTDTGCLYGSTTTNLIISPDRLDGCGTSPTTYSQSNAWWQNTSPTSPGSYWVLDMNNEPAYSNLNPGPPHVSLPRAEPGSGLMGFTMLKDTPAGENFYRAHLVMNQTFANPHGDEGIPFLAIGSDVRVSNSTPVGAINPSTGVPHRVRFTAKLWDFKAPICNSCQQPVATFALWANSEWGGIPRMLFLYLFHWNSEHRTEDPPGSGNFVPGQNAKWNWAIDEHYLYPGADIALVDAEDIQQLCGFWVKRLKNIGEEFTYTVDLDALFRCLADPQVGHFSDSVPPNTNIPINGVHWFNENSGTNGWLWTSVHGMKMLD